MGDDLKFAFTSFFEFLWIIVLIWIGMHLFTKNNLTDITKHYAEVTAVTGGFTDVQYNNMLEELRIRGFAEDSTSIVVKAIGPDGTDYSRIAKNVTHPAENGIYEGEPVYCPRGTEITLSIKSKKKSILSNIYEYFGVETNLSKGSSRKVYMSERVR